MKAIVLFIVLLLNSSIYTQTQEAQLKTNDWYVYKVVLNNQDYYYSPINNDENENTVNLFYYVDHIIILFCGETCGADDFLFIDDDEFSFADTICFGTTSCIGSGGFSGHYWQFWVYDQINHYQYEINQIDATTKELILTRDNGNKAYFYSTYLSS